MKKVVVNMIAVSEYSVEIDVDDDVDTNSILEIARNSVNHDTDVTDFNWTETGYWTSSSSPSYSIQTVK